jgi:hypothetical protein
MRSPLRNPAWARGSGTDGIAARGAGLRMLQLPQRDGVKV